MTPTRLLEDAEERRHGPHRFERRHSRTRPLKAGVKRRMGGHDQLGRLVLRPGVLLDEARDADALFRKDLPDRGQHTRAVVDPNAVVGPGHYLAHRHHGDSVVEAERRTALHAASYGTRQVDKIADHG